MRKFHLATVMQDPLVQIVEALSCTDNARVATITDANDGHIG